MLASYFFLHASSGRSWPTDDPHTWLLDHRDDDLLAPTRDRLLLIPDDPKRCLRVVLRRCGLMLVRVADDVRVVVQHWSEPAPDLRAWAKKEGFNRAGLAVTFVNVKTGTVVVHEAGLDLLVYGERVEDKFPWLEYIARYERRQVRMDDDQDAAPASATNFGWPGRPPHERQGLTWTVLKAIWMAESIPCPNCDVPLLVTSFSWHRGMLSYRSARVVRHCLRCHRRFEADVKKPLEWLTSVLEPHLRPTHLTLWRRFGIEWSDPNPRLI